MIADEMTMLRTFSSYKAARKAVKLLEKGGIKATIEAPGEGMGPRIQQSNDVQVIVRKSDANRAKEVLAGKKKRKNSSSWP